MTVEPRVEELLATIRKAIDNDISQLDLAQAKAGQGRGLGASMSGMRVGQAAPGGNADENLARLRERVARQKIEDRAAEPAPQPLPPRPVERIAPRNDGVSGILSGGTAQARRIAPELLRPSYADDVPSQQPVYAPQPYPPQVQEAQWVEEAHPQQAYYPPPPPQPPAGALMSPQAAYAAQASFQALADSMLARMGGEGQLQDYAQQLLRPLLKQWLDDNLPALVERLVREEIERVARRGR